MKKVILLAVIFFTIGVFISSGYGGDFTSIYEAEYSGASVVLECFPKWYPAWMSVSIVGVNAAGEVESIFITCLPLSIFIWSMNESSLFL